jgi:hypothetical protein
MALSSTLVWEIRGTGNAGNGGAFRAGAVGTDYSQQDSAQVVFTDLAVDATTSTKVSSIATPFSPTHVGNLINISSSTGGWTAGYYEVMAVSGTVATLDRSPAAVSTTGGVGKLGGATDSPVTIQAVVVNSNVVWMKAGSYSSMSPVMTATNNSPTATAPLNRFSGYTTTRGDGGRVTITPSGSYGLRVVNGWLVENLIVTGSGGVYGIYVGGGCQVVRCKVSNCTLVGMVAQSSLVFACEVTGMTGSTSIAIQARNYDVIGCYVHDNAGIGISYTGSGDAVRCIVANNGSDGIQLSSTGGAIGNTVYGNGGHGLNQTATDGLVRPVLGNIFANNGGYGAVFCSAAGSRATTFTDGNAYYNNTSGTRSNGDDGDLTAVNPQNASGAHVNTLDVILTGNPFVSAGTGDFRLNNTAGAGASCRAVAVPTSWPVLSITSYSDLGAVQHQDSGTGGGASVVGSSIVRPTRRHI